MQRRLLWSGIAALLTLAGCSDSTGPTRQELMGLYVSTTFTTTVHDSATDQQAEGGYVRIMLLNDELLVLETVIPPEAITESGEEVNTLGTWDIQGERVRLAPDSASLVQQIRFRSVDSTLVGEGTIGGVQVHLVLNPEPLN